MMNCKSKYSFGKNNPNIYLTKREAQITLCFVRKMNTTQIANYLGLSYRTVKFYTNNIKTKLGCRHKSEVVDKVIKSDFLKVIDLD